MLSFKGISSPSEFFVFGDDIGSDFNFDDSVDLDEDEDRKKPLRFLRLLNRPLPSSPRLLVLEKELVAADLASITLVIAGTEKDTIVDEDEDDGVKDKEFDFTPAFTEGESSTLRRNKIVCPSIKKRFSI